MIASSVLNDGRLYLWMAIALAVVLLAIFLIALALRSIAKRIRE